MSTAPTPHSPMLLARRLSKRFGGVTALDDFSFQVAAGEVVGLIGPNGAGKTTLFNVLTGYLRADAGELEVKGQRLPRPIPHRMLGCGVARTFQGLRLIGGITALDNVLLSFPHQRGEYVSRLWLAPRAIARQERTNTEQAREHLKRVGLAQKETHLARELSYGQQKLLSLACALATGAQIMLLDEPVAGVHPRIIELILALIGELAAGGKAVVLIEHNVRAMERVATRAIFMDQGRKIAEGTPAEVLADERVLEAYLA